MRSTASPVLVAAVAAVVIGFQWIAGAVPEPQAPARGANLSGSKLDRMKVPGASLEGNLEGDDPNRDVVVYLPPSYSKESGRRYPVVYFLHGYSVGVEAYVGLLKLQEAADKAISAGGREMILVLPDAMTIYSGSMFSNSPTTGDWEGYVSHDLVAYIDNHYRTVADRGSRGLSGHSMGGYGTMRIGMKHPEVFSALYSMSGCCLMNSVGAPPPAAGARGPAPAGGRGGGRAGGFENALSAQAAAWAPNPMNPPQYFDLPTKDGVVLPLIAAKWLANSPVVMVDQYVPNLKQYRAIAMDVGDMDTIGAATADLDKALTRLGIAHVFEQYPGDHTNRIAGRFVSHLLPFFSAQLK